MKKLLLILNAIALSLSLYGQATKPSLMVMPSEAWCNKHGFMEKYDNQGTSVLTPNYKLALQSSSELVNMISKIGVLMKDKGFPLQDLSAAIRNVERNTAMNRAATSKNSNMVAESPLDMLKRQAKADIILELDYTVNVTGPKKSVTYSLRGLDASTSKQVAGAQGTGAPSFSAEVAILLEEAVMANMDNFAAQLQSHFDDMFANGREVSIGIQVFENMQDIDLDTECDGKPLNRIIQTWMMQNTVKRRFRRASASENMIEYQEVRIPLFDEFEMPMDAQSFVEKLQDYLKSTCKLPSKIDPRGLGESILIIGDK